MRLKSYIKLVKLDFSFREGKQSLVIMKTWTKKLHSKILVVL